MDILQEHYYSSSESDEEPALDPLPPVPSTILDKYSISPNIEKYLPFAEMSFTKGKWNTFIFIEMRTNLQQRALLNRTISRINEKVRLLGVGFEPLHVSEMGSPQPLHISLSSNIEFSTRNELDVFSRMISIELMQKFPLKFDVAFNPILRLYDNYDKSALFLALDVCQDVKSRYLSKLSSIIEESIDCCNREETSVQQQHWSHENAHLSIARSSKSAITKDFVGNRHIEPQQAEMTFGQKLQELNQIVAREPLDLDDIRQFSFQCKGIKITKERASIWIPFANSQAIFS